GYVTRGHFAFNFSYKSEDVRRHSVNFDSLTRLTSDNIAPLSGTLQTVCWIGSLVFLFIGIYDSRISRPWREQLRGPRSSRRHWAANDDDFVPVSLTSRDAAARSDAKGCRSRHGARMRYCRSSRRAGVDEMACGAVE